MVEGSGGIVGRDAELARLATLMAAADQPASGGRGGALTLRGAPGTGKTALLGIAEADARARGFRVLAVRGTPVERHLAYAGLHLMLHPVLRQVLPGLAAGHRQAVQHAFGMVQDHGSPPPERFVVALGVLETVAELAVRSPVLLVADDVQWLDRATLDVLAFVARRLDDQRAVLLMGSRRAAASGASAVPAGELVLGPLPEPAARALIQAGAPGLSGLEARAVLRAAQGNPLALVELSRAVTRGGLPPAGDDVPLTDRLKTVFAGHVRDLPVAERELLLALALEDGGSPAQAGEVVGRSGEPAPALAGALRAGLVTVDGDVARFRHPLIRASVEELAAPSDRRSVHAAWARVLTDPDRRIWHRFCALEGSDESIAAELEQAANRSQARGALAAALAWWERSAQVSGPGRARQQRRLAAGEVAYQLGRPDVVQRILGALRGDVVDPAEADRLAWLEGVLDDGVAGDADGTARLVAGADRAVAAGRDDLAALLLLAASRRCWWGDLSGPRDPLMQVDRRLRIDAGDPRRLLIAAQADTVPGALDLLARLETWAARPLRDPDQAAMLATAAFNLADFERVLVFAGRAVDLLRAQGRLSVLAQVQVVTTWAALFVGRWESAYTAGAEAFELGVETGQPVWAAHGRLGQADLEGRLGRREQAMEMVVDAERTALLTGAATVLGGVEFTRGIIELGAQRPAEAYEHFRRTMDPDDRAYHSVERMWLVDYFAEAAAGCGQVVEARAVVKDLAASVRTAPTPGYLRAFRLAQVWLADDEEAEERVAAARDVASPAAAWYRARVDLADGMSLRRRRHVVRARRPLQDALLVFETLGAQAWAERARQELAATGLRATPAEHQDWSELSAQELQIARLAAGGLTNREIGARLFLSHRTVGSHLYRIFPKVGVRSRRELYRLFSGPPDD